MSFSSSSGSGINADRAPPTFIIFSIVLVLSRRSICFHFSSSQWYGSQVGYFLPSKSSGGFTPSSDVSASEIAVTRPHRIYNRIGYRFIDIIFSNTAYLVKGHRLDGYQSANINRKPGFSFNIMRQPISLVFSKLLNKLHLKIVNIWKPHSFICLEVNAVQCIITAFNCYLSLKQRLNFRKWNYFYQIKLRDLQLQLFL